MQKGQEILMNYKDRGKNKIKQANKQPPKNEQKNPLKS